MIALGVMEIRAPSSHESAYQMLEHNFVASARLTDDLLEAGIDAPRRRDPGRERTAKVLIRPGEVLSPFTHAMRAAGGPPSERGPEPCLEAVKRIVDWDVKRYDHFWGYGWQQLLPFFRDIFPRLTTSEHLDRIVARDRSPDPWLPGWAWFLVDLSAGQDKSKRLMNQFRSLNLPAVRELRGIFFDETAAEASTAKRGINGVLLSSYDLYLHRNIGFSVRDYQADIDDLIRHYSFPERCRVERIASGSLERREPPDYEQYGQAYWFWELDPENSNRGPISLPFHHVSATHFYIVDLMYVCD